MTSSEKNSSAKSGTQSFLVSSLFCWVRENVTVYDNVSLLFLNNYLSTLECVCLCVIDRHTHRHVHSKKITGQGKYRPLTRL